MKKRNESGFTLLELMIVMTILSIIAGMIWGNFIPTLAKGRDTRRKEDLEAVARSLDLYYNDHHSYPHPTGPLPTWGTPLTHETLTSVIYMQKLPSDPAYPQQNYCYNTDSDGTYFQLYANLENRNDSKLFTNPVLCQTVYYNYGISSSNTSAE